MVEGRVRFPAQFQCQYRQILTTHDMNIQKIIDNGGTTISLQGQVPTGYLVSLPFFEECSKYISDALVHDYISRHLKHLLKDNMYLGIWKNEGTWYLDISTCVQTLATATEIGRVFNQKAIFDCILQEEIKL
jgi:hypothetical protein